MHEAMIARSWPRLACSHGVGGVLRVFIPGSASVARWRSLKLHRLRRPAKGYA